MIKIEGKCEIEVNMEGLDGVNPDNFISLLVEEDAGGMPASFDLILRQANYDLIDIVAKGNTPISISYGKDASTRKNHEFYIVNYSYEPAKDGTLTLILTGLLDLSDFVSKPDILFIEGTSDKVLGSFSTVTPVIKYTGADEQVWLRHNITEKNWFDRILHHIFIAEDDVPLAALTTSKEMIVTSAKTALGETEKFTFTNADNIPNSRKVLNFRLLSNTAYLSKFLSEGRQVKTVSLLERELNDPTPKPTNIDGQVHSHTTDNAQFPPILDNGNCHAEYYNAPVSNLAKLVDFERFLVEFDLNDIYFSDDDLKLLDPVIFQPSDATSGVSQSKASGKYLVAGKKSFFSQTDLRTTLTLARSHV